MARFSAKRFEGTYMREPRIEWLPLSETGFNNPRWADFYPINPNSNMPVGILPPRLACKLFYDSLDILNKCEMSDKYLEHRLPPCVHRLLKRKQWKKQFIECGRRVACRLAKGNGFSSNCFGEDIFAYAVVKEAPEFGWRRLDKHLEGIPESERDRDYGRILRFVSNDEMTALFRADNNDRTTGLHDGRNWFNCYEKGDKALTNHVIVTARDDDPGDEVVVAATIGEH